MTYRHSLRHRIVKSFCVFGAFLSLFYAMFIFLSFSYMEEHLEKNLYRKRIWGELNAFLEQYAQDSSIKTPRSPYLTIYLDLSSMPEPLKRMVAGRPDGVYEVEEIKAGKESEYNFLVHTIPETRRKIYLFYDAGFLELSEGRLAGVFIILAAGYVLVFFISIWIGRATSRKVIEPLVHLAGIVEKTDADNLPVDLSATFYHDEVGTLAKALEQAMRRIRLFMQREQQFTRNASHELRTPVTVIKGAVELLKQHPAFANPGIHPPVLRIDRAVSDIEDTIDSFLWLARERDAMKTDGICDVFKIIHGAEAQHRHLIENKPLVVEMVQEAELQVNAPRSLVKIVLGNLIKNAFHYTTRGCIRIVVKADRVVIEDTGTGISPEMLPHISEPGSRGPESKGLGIGLSIVKMICERFGWRFDIESNAGNGTSVQVIFK